MTLDREKTPTYHLIALAIDSRNTSMSASANVTVFVADRNDNEPIIAFPSASNYTVQVRIRVIYSESKSPLGFSGCFSQTLGNSLSKFYATIIRSYTLYYKFLFNYLQL